MSSQHFGPSKVTMRDADGKVIFEGIVDSYSMKTNSRGHVVQDMYPSISFTIEGYIRQLSQQEVLAASTVCDHAWETYNGLVESYDYCKICGDKK